MGQQVQYHCFSRLNMTKLFLGVFLLYLISEPIHLVSSLDLPWANCLVCESHVFCGPEGSSLPFCLNGSQCTERQQESCSQSLPQNSKQICDRPGMFPDKGSPKNYYKCSFSSESEELSKQKLECPDNTTFDPYVFLCLKEEEKEVKNMVEKMTPVRNTQELTMSCQKPGTSRHPEDCKMYYFCDDDLRLEIFYCPFGTYYNYQEEKCTSTLTPTCKSQLNEIAKAQESYSVEFSKRLTSFTGDLRSPDNAMNFPKGNSPNKLKANLNSTKGSTTKGTTDQPNEVSGSTNKEGNIHILDELKNKASEKLEELKKLPERVLSGDTGEIVSGIANDVKNLAWDLLTGRARNIKNVFKLFSRKSRKSSQGKRVSDDTVDDDEPSFISSLEEMFKSDGIDLYPYAYLESNDENSTDPLEKKSKDDEPIHRSMPDVDSKASADLLQEFERNITKLTADIDVLEKDLDESTNDPSNGPVNDKPLTKRNSLKVSLLKQIIEVLKKIFNKFKNLVENMFKGPGCDSSYVPTVIVVEIVWNSAREDSPGVNSTTSNVTDEASANLLDLYERSFSALTNIVEDTEKDVNQSTSDAINEAAIQEAKLKSILGFIIRKLLNAIKSGINLILKAFQDKKCDYKYVIEKIVIKVPRKYRRSNITDKGSESDASESLRSEGSDKYNFSQDVSSGPRKSDKRKAVKHAEIGSLQPRKTKAAPSSSSRDLRVESVEPVTSSSVEHANFSVESENSTSYEVLTSTESYGVSPNSTEPETAASVSFLSVKPTDNETRSAEVPCDPSIDSKCKPLSTNQSQPAPPRLKRTEYFPSTSKDATPEIKKFNATEFFYPINKTEVLNSGQRPKFSALSAKRDESESSSSSNETETSFSKPAGESQAAGSNDCSNAEVGASDSCPPEAFADVVPEDDPFDSFGHIIEFITKTIPMRLSKNFDNSDSIFGAPDSPASLDPFNPISQPLRFNLTDMLEYSNPDTEITTPDSAKRSQYFDSLPEAAGLNPSPTEPYGPFKKLLSSAAEKEHEDLNRAGKSLVSEQPKNARTDVKNTITATTVKTSDSPVEKTPFRAFRIADDTDSSTQTVDSVKASTPKLKSSSKETDRSDSKAAADTNLFPGQSASKKSNASGDEPCSGAESAECLGNGNETFKCPQLGIFRDPHDCHSYYRCTRKLNLDDKCPDCKDAGDSILASHHTCRNGKYFSSSLWKCVKAKPLICP